MQPSIADTTHRRSRLLHASGLPFDACPDRCLSCARADTTNAASITNPSLWPQLHLPIAHDGKLVDGAHACAAGDDTGREKRRRPAKPRRLGPCDPGARAQVWPGSIAGRRQLRSGRVVGDNFRRAWMHTWRQGYSGAARQRRATLSHSIAFDAINDPQLRRRMTRATGNGSADKHFRVGFRTAHGRAARGRPVFAAKVEIAPAREVSRADRPGRRPAQPAGRWTCVGVPLGGLCQVRCRPVSISRIALVNESDQR